MNLRHFFENPETRSFSLTILLILFLRGHLVEPFKIPSPSMVPTILIGDHLFVSKSSYRIHIPFTNIEVLRISEPKPADIVVFKYPNYENSADKEGFYYIKRLIGVPGNKVKVVGGVPYINGVAAKQELIPEGMFPTKLSPSFEPSIYYNNYFETLPGTESKHIVQRQQAVLSSLPAAVERLRLMKGSDCIEVGSFPDDVYYESYGVQTNNICEFEVPQDKFFVMGDNRDHSSDGRAWGFVPRELMVGKALFIWLSCKSEEEGGGLCLLPWNWRWNRLGLPMR